MSVAEPIDVEAYYLGLGAKAFLYKPIIINVPMNANLADL